MFGARDSLRSARTVRTVVFLSVMLAVVGMLSVPAIAGGKGNPEKGGGKDPGCARASTSVTIDPVPLGYSTGITSPVTNCSNSRQRYYVSHYYTDACGDTVLINRARIAFRAGETKLVNVGYRPADDVCLGLGEITAKVTSGSSTLATAYDDLTVTD